MNIAKEFDIRFDPPVVAIWSQEFMLEEESRVETTHIPVWYTSCVYDTLSHHLQTAVSSFFFVNPVRLIPMFSRYLAKRYWGISKYGYTLFEIVCEWLLVEQHPRIFVVSIKAVLHLSYTRYDTSQIIVSTKEDESSVGSLPKLRQIRIWGMRWIGRSDLGQIGDSLFQSEPLG